MAQILSERFESGASGGVYSGKYLAWKRSRGSNPRLCSNLVGAGGFGCTPRQLWAEATPLKRE